MTDRVTLKQTLEITNDGYRKLESGAYQVFYSVAKSYFGLSDYVVTSAVSGPSLILVPRS